MQASGQARVSPHSVSQGRLGWFQTRRNCLDVSRSAGEGRCWVPVASSCWMFLARNVRQGADASWIFRCLALFSFAVNFACSLSLGAASCNENRIGNRLWRMLVLAVSVGVLLLSCLARVFCVLGHAPRVARRQRQHVCETGRNLARKVTQLGVVCSVA